MRSGIRAKVTIISSIVLIISIGVNSFILSSIYKSEHTNSLHQNIAFVGKTLKEKLLTILDLGIPVDEIYGFNEQCREITEKSFSLSYAMVVTLNGKILFHNQSEMTNGMIADPLISNNLLKKTESVLISKVNGEEVHDFFFPVIRDGGKHVATIRIGYPVKLINQKTRKLVIYAVLFAVFLMILSIIVILASLNVFVVNPVKYLANVMQDINSPDTINAMQLQVKSNDELGKLTDTFNKMSLRIHKDYLTRKRFETSLKHAKEQAESGNRAKSIFLANISHELRTPMHHILSFSRFGMDKTGQISDERLVDYFTRINKSSHRLMNLLNDLLDLSRLESGKMDYLMKPSDLFRIISEISEEQEINIKIKGLRINIIHPDFSTELICDENKIKQVVFNLLENAVKFTTEQSTITIQINKSALIKHSEMIPLFEVSIKDQGPGVPSDEIMEIFETFTQSSETKTDAGGTGLGLAISKTIVNDHHGQIQAKNNIDVGVTFSFSIPLKPPVVNDAYGNINIRNISKVSG